MHADHVHVLSTCIELHRHTVHYGPFVFIKRFYDYNDKDL